MSHRPREDEQPVIDLDSRGPKERIIRGLSVIQGGGDPDEIKKRLVEGKIADALGRVLADGQLPDGVEK